MENCDLCTKLIARGEIRCHTCRVKNPLPENTESTVPQEIAPEEIPDTNADLYSDTRCVRCRKHNAMLESDFCLACQLELLSLLGDAAHELFQVPEPPPKPPVASAVSLMSEVEDKRDRTATSRIRVVGAAKLK